MKKYKGAEGIKYRTEAEAVISLLGEAMLGCFHGWPGDMEFSAKDALRYKKRIISNLNRLEELSK